LISRLWDALDAFSPFNIVHFAVLLLVAPAFGAWLERREQNRRMSAPR
jgi:hypothetical protein